MKKQKYHLCLLYILASVILVIEAYPIIWTFLTSFKTQDEIRWSSSVAFPQSLNFDNYIHVLSESQLPLYFRNSIIVTFLTIFLLIILASTSGFALQKLRFHGQGLVLGFFMAGITIPIHVTLIPLFQIYRQTGLLNTHFSLILPQIGFNLPMSIYLFTAFYRFIPNELLEASVIDGASITKSFLRIILPMSKNTICTIVTMNAVFTWNEFIFANTFISDKALKTVPVGLYDFVGEKGATDWGSTFSAISLVLLPILLICFIFSKQLTTGMAAGAIKE